VGIHRVYSHDGRECSANDTDRLYTIPFLIRAM
jgi:hypothetical protein